jgi:serine/threonine-protein kinase CTR1
MSGDRARVPSSSINRRTNSDADSGGRGRQPVDAELEPEGRAGTADGDQRKLKRLQQEIQRLTQRLKESDLYSSPDDGLPVFSLDDVEIGAQIAQGGFSSVHVATWKCTACALKKIFDPVITAELRGEFENEVKMLRRLRHPNIITLMAVCRQPPALSILTECVGGGSLFELLHGPAHARRHDSLDCELTTTLPFMLQTASTLAYLHAMLVVHRDIKSHNVLLTPQRPSIAKLCDFGLSRSKADLQTGTMQYAGTPCYMAPELFAQRKYNEAVDVFAFGVLLWETLSTEIPHANIEPSDISHRVQTKDYAGLNVAHSWPKLAKTLLRQLLAVQADDRPAMIAVTPQVQQVIMEMPPPDW